jgi:hypothetical protein
MALITHCLLWRDVKVFQKLSAAKKQTPFLQHSNARLSVYVYARDALLWCDWMMMFV